MAASSEKFELSQDDLESLLDQVRNSLGILAKPRCKDKNSQEHRHWAARVRCFTHVNHVITILISFMIYHGLH